MSVNQTRDHYFLCLPHHSLLRLSLCCCCCCCCCSLNDRRNLPLCSVCETRVKALFSCVWLHDQLHNPKGKEGSKALREKRKLVCSGLLLWIIWPDLIWIYEFLFGCLYTEGVKLGLEECVRTCRSCCWALLCGVFTVEVVKHQHMYVDLVASRSCHMLNGKSTCETLCVRINLSHDAFNVSLFWSQLVWD